MSPDPDAPLLVYTTVPDPETGLAIGEALVGSGLAACVNVLPGMRSVYRWQGEIERGAEAVAIVKTTARHRDAAAALLKARHPYETPVILYLAPEGGDPATLAWLRESTATT